ncbi:MAG: twin-arginine translocase TatA/TatE family subunit [Fimbriimonadia bacterium]|jgi:sec-independent protein translocase protein TatA
MIGTPELVVGGILILVLFGAKRIPELARSVGQAVGELQKGIRESQRVVRETVDEEPEETKTPQ